MITPSADESAEILTAKLRAREPFVFVRLGDADVPWMLDKECPITCDGEVNRPGLAEDLQAAWKQLCESPHFLCGDLCSMEGPAEPWIQEAFRGLCAPYPEMKYLHSETLLIHRLTPALKDFYRAVRDDRRVKVLVAPMRIAQGTNILRANGFAVIHPTEANRWDGVAGLTATFERMERFQWDVLLIVGGRASKIIAGHMAQCYPERTIIELGSALDPLFVGRTRSGQVSMAQARGYFSDFLA